MSLRLIFRESNEVISQCLVTAVENQNGEKCLQFTVEINHQHSSIQPAGTVAIICKIDHEQAVKQADPYYYQDYYQSGAYNIDDYDWLVALKSVQVPYIDYQPHVVDAINIAMLWLLAGRQLPDTIFIEDDSYLTIPQYRRKFSAHLLAEMAEQSPAEFRHRVDNFLTPPS